MTTMAVKVAADGGFEELDSNSYDTVRKAIGGGWVEQVLLPSTGLAMYVDEEGLMKELRLNITASNIFGRYIVGDAVFTHFEGIDSELPIPAHKAKYIRRMHEDNYPKEATNG